MRDWKQAARGLLLGALALAAAPAPAQEEVELDWRWRAEAVPGAPGEVELVANAPVRPGWIVYAAGFDAGDFGPRPARLAVESGGQALQPLRAEGAQERSGSNFAGEYRYAYFAGQATFRQRVRLEPGAREVSGTLAGQSCHEGSGLCTLFKAPFAVVP
ncbi:disulfide bond formation protein DsbD [Pseudoxanthomonas sp. SGT-18]|uniref:disulfide bond formation protein DsbD n=1 Tax=Pseudoxanthomonas sp. SGT-18 TaxID=2493087 RepID=UPI000F62B843|nr:disulfide bond formation protein DsbD [Pseudoxanthomonas sp. SGT-18]